MTEDRDRFREDIETYLGDWIRESEDNAIQFWSALANVSWHNPKYEIFGEGYSFRAAGGLISEIRQDGSDYMTWYCSGPYSQVSDTIARRLKKAGWIYDTSPEVCDEPDCFNDAGCGWPQGDKYRVTCGDHFSQAGGLAIVTPKAMGLEE